MSLTHILKIKSDEERYMQIQYSGYKTVVALYHEKARTANAVRKKNKKSTTIYTELNSRGGIAFFQKKECHRWIRERKKAGGKLQSFFVITPHALYEYNPAENQFPHI